MGYGVIQPPAYVAGTTAWQKIGQEAAPTKVRSFTLRALNIGAADGYGHSRLNNGVAQIPGVQNFPVPYQSPGSAPDLEQNLTVPAGYWVEVMASNNGVVGFRLSTVEDDA